MQGMTSNLSTSPIERSGASRLWLGFVSLVHPVLAPFLLSRLCVLVTAVFLEWLVDSGRAFRYEFIGQAPLATLSATFDANWYSDIAAHGYSVSSDVTIQQNYQFFPLFPLLMRVFGTILGLSGVHGGFNLAGVIVNHVLFLGCLALLYRLTLTQWGDAKFAKYTVWAMAFLPWSFVFSMAYSESLYLFTSLAAITLACQGQLKGGTGYIISVGLLSALAALTRPQGLTIALTIALLLIFSREGVSLYKRTRNVVLVLAPTVTALVGFAVYIATSTGNPWAVIQSGRPWGQGWLQDIGRIFLLPPENPFWIVDIVSAFGLVVWIGLLFALIAMFFSRTAHWMAPRPLKLLLVGYSVVYFLLTIVTAPANGSWGRYMVVVFPCVWVVAAIAQRLTKRTSAKLLLVTAVALQTLLFSSAIILQVTP
jgi:hypothetical protein